MRKAVLDLSKCSAEDMNTFPDMKVDGEVELPDLGGNEEIERIPILGLKVEGNLYLTGCESLKSLPEGLSVKGGLYLRDCTLLTSLPAGLKVGGSLSLYGCELLTSLPQDLKVEGHIYCDYKTGFAKIEGFIEGFMDKPEIIPVHLRNKLIL